MPSGVSKHTFQLIIDGDAGIRSARAFRQNWDKELGAMGRPGAGMSPEQRLSAIQGGLDAVSTKFLAVGAAGAAGFGLAVKAATDWESSWTSVTKTVNDATDAHGQLTAAGQELQTQLRAMARDTVPLENAHAVLAELAATAGQLGIQTPYIAGFAETMAQLGVSTEDLPANEAAMALAQFANITKMSQQDFDRLGSTIVHLGNNLATTEGQIVAFAQRIAGAGEIAGLSEADILAISGALSSVGIQAEAGGTSVQKLLIAMTQAMSGEGGIVDNTEAIQDAEQSLIGLNAKLVTLEAQTGASGDELRQMYDEFIASGGAVEDFGRLLGDTKRRQLFQTTQAVDEMTASLALLREQHGNAFDPEQLAIFAETAGMTVAEFKELWEQDAAQAFARFVEGLGRQGDAAFGTLEKLNLADQRLTRAFISLAGNSELLYDALGLANTAWEENTALAEEASKRFDTTEYQMNRFKNTMTDTLVVLGSTLLPRVNKALEMGSDALMRFVNAFESLSEEDKQRWVNLALSLTGATLALGGMGKAASGLMGTYQGLSKAMSVFNARLGLLAVAAAGLGIAWKTNFLGIQDVTYDVLERLGELRERFGELVQVAQEQGIEALFTPFEDGSSYIGEFLEDLGLAEEAADGVSAALGRLFTAYQAGGLESLSTQLVSEVQQVWPLVQAELARWGVEFWDWVEVTALPLAGEKLGMVAGEVQKAWPVVKAELAQWGTEFWDWFEVTALPLAGEKLGLLAGEVQKAWPLVQAELARWGEEFWGWLETEALPLAGEKLGGLEQAVADAWPGVKEQLAVWGAEFWDWINQEAIPQSSEKLNEVADALVAWSESPETGEQMARLGEVLGKGLVDGIVALIAGGYLLTKITLAFKEIPGKMAEVTSNLTADIVSGFIGGIGEKLGIDMAAVFSDVLETLGVQNADKWGQELATALAGGFQKGLETAASMMNPVAFIRKQVAGIGGGVESAKELGTELGMGGFIEDAARDVEGAFGQLKEMGQGLAGQVLPWWMQGESPPPLADWLNYIADAASRAGAGLGTMGQQIPGLGMPGMDMGLMGQQLQQSFGQQFGAAAGTSPLLNMLIGDTTQFGPQIQEQLRLALTGMEISPEVFAESPAGFQIAQAFSTSLRAGLGSIQFSEMLGEAMEADFKANADAVLRPLVLPIGIQLGDWLAAGAAQSSFAQTIIAAVMEQLADAVAPGEVA